MPENREKNTENIIKRIIRKYGESHQADSGKIIPGANQENQDAVEEILDKRLAVLNNGSSTPLEEGTIIRIADRMELSQAIALLDSEKFDEAMTKVGATGLNDTTRVIKAMELVDPQVAADYKTQDLLFQVDEIDLEKKTLKLTSVKTGEFYTVTKDQPLTIGRNSEKTLLIPPGHKFVSGDHGKISFEDGKDGEDGKFSYQQTGRNPSIAIQPGEPGALKPEATNKEGVIELSSGDRKKLEKAIEAAKSRRKPKPADGPSNAPPDSPNPPKKPEAPSLDERVMANLSPEALRELREAALKKPSKPASDDPSAPPAPPGSPGGGRGGGGGGGRG